MTIWGALKLPAGPVPLFVLVDPEGEGGAGEMGGASTLVDSARSGWLIEGPPDIAGGTPTPNDGDGNVGLPDSCMILS